MGGMIYEEELQRGVKKTLPPPRVIEFARSCNLEEMLCEGKKVFFPNAKVKLSVQCKGKVKCATHM